MNVIRRLRAALADRRSIEFCDSCGSVCICDTACRVSAARDRALTTYLTMPGH
jgi:hypothetical protein